MGRPVSDTQHQPATPRRDVLGFFRSVVEFFTGMTGLAAACVGLLGTAVTIALASGALEVPTISAPAGGLIDTIESTIQSDLGARLAETGAVIDDLSCAQDSDTLAHCTAAISGTGPATYSIDVEIDPSTGLFQWLIVDAV